MVSVFTVYVPTSKDLYSHVYFSFPLANEVLWEALKPGFHGIPREMAQNAAAVALLSVAQVGFLITGSIGTGILMCKKADGTWSHPSACGLVGCGYGLLAGASVKHMIVFIQGTHGLNAITSETGLQVGGQAEATLGPFGRNIELDLNFSNRGAGTSHAIAFSKGAFLGVSAQGAVVGARLAANHKFYGVDVTPRQILLDDHAVRIPREWRPLMDEVYAKLIALTSQYDDDDDYHNVVQPDVEEEEINLSTSQQIPTSSNHDAANTTASDTDNE